MTNVQMRKNKSRKLKGGHHEPLYLAFLAITSLFNSKKKRKTKRKKIKKRKTRRKRKR